MKRMPGHCTESACGRYTEWGDLVLVTLADRPDAAPVEGARYGEAFMCPECAHAYLLTGVTDLDHRARIRARATGESVAEARTALESTTCIDEPS